MMTAQEAIERLTAIVEFCSGGRENATLHGKPLSQDDEEIRQLNFSALELAISALEKQIPKEPEYRSDGYCPDGTEVWDDYCPNCEYELNKEDICPNCGQAICWDATEDEDGK